MINNWKKDDVTKIAFLLAVICLLPPIESRPESVFKKITDFVTGNKARRDAASLHQQYQGYNNYNGHGQPPYHDRNDMTDRYGLEGYGQSSPAMSALSLLGFLFFLNLISQTMMMPMMMNGGNGGRKLRSVRSNEDHNFSINVAEIFQNDACIHRIICEAKHSLATSTVTKGLMELVASLFNFEKHDRSTSRQKLNRTASHQKVKNYCNIKFKKCQISV